MQLTRKQVKALLDVISSDETRPVLNNLVIDKYENKIVAVATDGYKLVALDTEISEDHLGKVVSRENLIKWYKLANAKDRLDDKWLLEMTEELNADYPKWQDLIPKGDPTPSNQICLDAQYLLTMSTLADSHLILNFYNKDNHVAPIVSRANNGLYVIMPVRA